MPCCSWICPPLTILTQLHRSTAPWLVLFALRVCTFRIWALLLLHRGVMNLSKSESARVLWDIPVLDSRVLLHEQANTRRQVYGCTSIHNPLKLRIKQRHMCTCIWHGNLFSDITQEDRDFEKTFYMIKLTTSLLHLIRGWMSTRVCQRLSSECFKCLLNGELKHNVVTARYIRHTILQTPLRISWKIIRNLSRI